MFTKYGLGVQDADEVRTQVRGLRASGEELVLTQALYAIIGAVALQKGGDLAIQTIRQKILSPLGLI